MNATLPAPPSAVRPALSYLAEGRTLTSWLLTTDHKRIGLLYLYSFLLYFTIAAVTAAMMRIELITPQGDLVTSETYNKLFTIHGTLMVWFFLIPSIPAVLGNFGIVGTRGHPPLQPCATGAGCGVWSIQRKPRRAISVRAASGPHVPAA